MASFGERLKNSWNAFLGRDPTVYPVYGSSYSYKPDRTRLSYGNEKSIVTAIYNRIAIDVSLVDIHHVRLDDDGNFKEIIDSNLNNALSVQSNLDQTARSFIMDVVISLFDEGYVAIVPVDTTTKPYNPGAYDILSLRTGKILEWYPQDVKVQVYNELDGKKEDLILPKRFVGIVENPFYYVMNEPNSTLKRLIRTLNNIDRLDEQNSSGKLDLIIQLPYVVKTQTQREQAKVRRKEIEDQLMGSKYGIAYTDGTERITQLNRPVENNLWQQAQDLTSTLYNQIGITQTILDCTADEKTMNNYLHNTIEPILLAIVEAMNCKFLTKTARSQHQTIKYFMDPFRLVPVNQLADMADKFTRNAILSSNEVRAIVGKEPSNDPKADELSNKNINQSSDNQPPGGNQPQEEAGSGELTNISEVSQNES